MDKDFLKILGLGAVGLPRRPRGIGARMRAAATKVRLEHSFFGSEFLL
jgi:hypothetical protein